jgi:tetratricopeptide (TPR) repeat protein
MLEKTLLLLALVSPGAEGYVGNSACAPCHSKIFRDYSATPMALSSGTVQSETFPADLESSKFVHPRSGVQYRVSKNRDAYFLEFERTNPKSPERQLRDRRRLDYFVGSGAAGRSYLFALDGFLYQLPVTYYSRLKKWDMSPGYDRYDHVSLTRAIETNCLECHASNLQAVDGTQNRYDDPPFLQGGIGCERCHGPGRKHIEKMSLGQPSGVSGIVNPAKLDSLRRDSICEQCHLTGAARIARAGRSLAAFRPGDLLADFVISFVSADVRTQALKATSHVEKLWQSRCKKASGDRLWCGSCHDPHFLPGEAERAHYFREKCLTCHQANKCKTKVELRRANGDDCASCHMPKNRVVDGGHGVLTDHTIAKPGITQARSEGTTLLVPFRGAVAAEREVGLAHAEVALSAGSESSSTEAIERLEQAIRKGAGDSEVFYRLAHLYDRAGERDKAIALYERALRLNPALVVVAVNLANHYGTRGRIAEAIHLWQDALSRNPALEEARINIAIAHLNRGDTTQARAVLLKALEFSPDSPLLRRLLGELAGGK